MPRIWRICQRKWADTAFSGRGAADNPGRWNSLGRRAVYCAETRALAALEVLAHVESRRRLRHVAYVVIPVDVADRLVARPTRYPSDWNAIPPARSSRSFGDRQLAGSHPVLRVPSAVVEGEFCFVLNPDHANFSELKIGTPIPFSFDERIVLAAE